MTQHYFSFNLRCLTDLGSHLSGEGLQTAIPKARMSNLSMIRCQLSFNPYFFGPRMSRPFRMSSMWRRSWYRHSERKHVRHVNDSNVIVFQFSVFQSKSSWLQEILCSQKLFIFPFRREVHSTYRSPKSDRLPSQGVSSSKVFPDPRRFSVQGSFQSKVFFNPRSFSILGVFEFEMSFSQRYSSIQSVFWSKGSYQIMKVSLQTIFMFSFCVGVCTACWRFFILNGPCYVRLHVPSLQPVSFLFFEGGVWRL